MVSNGQIDHNDKEILKEVHMKTTLPLFSMKYGEMYPWIFAQFENSIIGSSAILTSLRRTSPNPKLSFNTSIIKNSTSFLLIIEPLVYSSSFV